MTLNEVFQFELFLLVSGLIWKMNTNMLGLLLLIRHNKAGDNDSETQSSAYAFWNARDKNLIFLNILV